MQLIVEKSKFLRFLQLIIEQIVERVTNPRFCFICRNITHESKLSTLHLYDIVFRIEYLFVSFHFWVENIFCPLQTLENHQTKLTHTIGCTIKESV